MNAVFFNVGMQAIAGCVDHTDKPFCFPRHQSGVILYFSKAALEIEVAKRKTLNHNYLFLEKVLSKFPNTYLNIL